MMDATGWPCPWPIEQLISALQEGKSLASLVAPRGASTSRDVREDQLERVVASVMKITFGTENVSIRRQIKVSLQLPAAPFPGSSQPDILVKHDGQIHLCEVKSSRCDYNRFDCVFESKPFREYLLGTGHCGHAPWEVEQDLIKLHLYPSLSPTIGSCLLLMVDAYSGPQLSWTKVFSDAGTFRQTMRTTLVQGWAERLLNRTRIVPLATTSARAHLIICEVVCADDVRQNLID